MTKKFIHRRNYKTWEITSSGNTVTIWSNSEETVKTFDTEEEANKALKKLANAKKRAGYSEVLLAIPKVSLRALYDVEWAKRMQSEKLEVNVEESTSLCDEIHKMLIKCSHRILEQNNVAY